MVYETVRPRRVTERLQLGNTNCESQIKKGRLWSSQWVNSHIKQTARKWPMERKEFFCLLLLQYYDDNGFDS